MKGSGAYEEYKEFQGTLESLQHQEFYTLTPVQKIKVHQVSFYIGAMTSQS